MSAAPDCTVEQGLLSAGGRLIAFDEVGRGALAGPVTVGAVVLSGRFDEVPAGLRDSKLLTPRARQQLVEPVRRWVDAWAIGHAEASEIDEIGIMAALRLAGYRALAALQDEGLVLGAGLPGVELRGEGLQGEGLQAAGERIDVGLLDGNIDYLSPPMAHLPGLGAGGVIPSSLPKRMVTRVRADRDCASVAAASVLAKVSRDAVMEGLATRFPAYDWARNKGYGTAAHAAAIAAHGDVPGSGVVLGLGLDEVSHRAMVSENRLKLLTERHNARWLLISLPFSSFSGN